MKNTVSFFRCELCGNIVEIVNEGGGTLSCCGKPMKKLEANTSDGAQEKHVPVAERRDDKVFVRIGSVGHPMLDEHYIQWIAMVTADTVDRVALVPGSKPEAVFSYKGEAEIYEYCNIHGLWKTNL